MKLHFAYRRRARLQALLSFKGKWLFLEAELFVVVHSMVPFFPSWILRVGREFAQD